MLYFPFPLTHYHRTLSAGGVQLIISGDFLQLPPVAKDNSVKMVFLCDTWKTAIHRTVFLETTFRQKDDKFVQILNSLRKGVVSPLAMEELKKCENRNMSGVTATRLYCTRRNVDMENLRELKYVLNFFVCHWCLEPSPLRVALCFLSSPRTNTTTTFFSLKCKTVS